MDSMSNVDSNQDQNGSKAIVTTIAIGAETKQIANAMPTPRSLVAMSIPICRFNSCYK